MLLLALAAVVLGVSGGNLSVVELSSMARDALRDVQVRAAVLVTCLVVLACQHLLGAGGGERQGARRSEPAGSR